MRQFGGFAVLDVNDFELHEFAKGKIKRGFTLIEVTTDFGSRFSYWRFVSFLLWSVEGVSNEESRILPMDLLMESWSS